MKEYIVKEKWVEIILESGKTLKVDKQWADKSIKNLDTDIEDVLLYI